MNSNKITFLKRILIIVYESFLLFAVYVLTGLPITFAFKIIWDPTIPTLQQPTYVLYLLYVLVVFFLYFGYCWTRTGQTLAMKAWRCKVSNPDGSKISWSQAFKRYVVAIVSWGIFGLGFLLSLIRKDRSTLHDLISNSYLYKIEKQD